MSKSLALGGWRLGVVRLPDSPVGWELRDAVIATLNAADMMVALVALGVIGIVMALGIKQVERRLYVPPDTKGIVEDETPWSKAQTAGRAARSASMTPKLMPLPPWTATPAGLSMTMRWRSS